MIRVAAVMGKMNSGGKKNLVLEYYRHINKERVQFDFICDSDSEAIPYDEIERLGGRVFLVSPYQKILVNMSDIYRLCKENNFDIVHSYNNTLNIFALSAAWLAGIRVRINESLSMGHKNDKKNKLKKILRLFSGCFSTHFISCGKECGRWQFGERRFALGKVEVFTSVVNAKVNSFRPELRAKVRQEYGWTDRIVIGHIGRFTAQKNQLFLLQIFSEAVKLEPAAVLCLIGDGELRGAIMEKIDELGLADNVCYLGRREDIQQFYNAMDVFLLPSLYEGLPITGLEAESSGLPVLFSTEVPSESSPCNDLGHFISLDEVPEVWAKELLSAAKSNIPIRYSRTKEIVNAGFDSESEARRLEEYYLRISNQAKRK